MKKALVIACVVLAVLGIYVLSTRNGFIARDENLNTAWAQVQTVLQRRYDLIPNLVKTVKGYATHEKDLLENIAKYRTAWAGAKSPSDQVAAASQLEGAIGRLMMVAESYPDLKANQNFMALQDELAGSENRISTERQRYNEAVKAYNVAVRTAPASMIASMFNFMPRPYFEAASEAKNAPQVEF